MATAVPGQEARPPVVYGAAGEALAHPAAHRHRGRDHRDRARRRRHRQPRWRVRRLPDRLGRGRRCGAPADAGRSDDAALGMAAGPRSPAPTSTAAPWRSHPATDRSSVIFLAHWCPHCQAEVPLLSPYLAGDDAPEGLQTVAVSTGVDSTRDNYPPDQWLEGSELADAGHARRQRQQRRQRLRADGLPVLRRDRRGGRRRRAGQWRDTDRGVRRLPSLVPRAHRGVASASARSSTSRSGNPRARRARRVVVLDLQPAPPRLTRMA